MTVYVGVENKCIRLPALVLSDSAELQESNQLLHGSEKHLYGDQAYVGRGGKIRAKALKVRYFTRPRCK